MVFYKRTLLALKCLSDRWIGHCVYIQDRQLCFQSLFFGLGQGENRGLFPPCSSQGKGPGNVFGDRTFSGHSHLFLLIIKIGASVKLSQQANQKNPENFISPLPSPSKEC